MKAFELYDWQENDVDQIVKAEGNALIVTQVGGGKTLISVEAAKRLGHKTILVIAPQGTHEYGWRRHVEAQYGEDLVRRLETSKPGKEALADLQWGVPGWYICTPQWFALRDWKNIKPDMAIFDEIHVAGAYKNVTRKRLHMLKAKSRVGLSGTPLRNKFENAWSIVRWIFPAYMPDTFWSWRMQQDTKYSRFAPQNAEVIGEKNPGELVSSLPCYIQHLQREECCEFHPNGFLDGLDEPEPEIRTVDMTPKQKQFYKSMEKNLVAWLQTPDEKGNLPVVAEIPIVARGMLRFCALAMPSVRSVEVKVKNRDTGLPDLVVKDRLYYEEDAVSPKFDELVQVLTEIGDESALVFTHSRQFAHLATARLNAMGIPTFEWSGAATQKARDEARQKFIDGEYRIVVGVISAMGTGTDGFQLATSTEIWMSEDDDLTNNVQARGRVDRPGQAEKVSRIYIQANGTYDQGIMSAQIQKQLALNANLRKK